jgi:signal transduction histidine kinase
MSTPDIRKIMDDTYDDSREGSIRSMVSDFYCRRMLWASLGIWAIGLVFFVGAIFAAVKFFGVDQTRDQILYATAFLTFVILLTVVKTFAWQLLHRNGLAREIKRLEIRLAELAKSLDK